MPPPERIRVVKTFVPQFPEELLLTEKEATVRLDILIDEDGNCRMAKVISAETPELGLAARRAAEHWKFNPMPDGAKGWRKVTLPMGFSPKDMETPWISWSTLDVAPTLLHAPAAIPPDEVVADRLELAQVGILVGTDGEVVASEINAITNELWRDTAWAAVKQWRFSPPIDEEKRVRTFVSYPTMLPSMKVVRWDGMPVFGEEMAKKGDNAELISRGIIGFGDYSKEDKELKPAMWLLELTVNRFGRARDITVLASSRPELDQRVIDGVRLNFTFKPATQDGGKVNQRILLPIRELL